MDRPQVIEGYANPDGSGRGDWSQSIATDPHIYSLRELDRRAGRPERRKDEPCLACGAPIGADGIGHDPGCVSESRLEANIAALRDMFAGLDKLTPGLGIRASNRLDQIVARLRGRL